MVASPGPPREGIDDAAGRAVPRWVTSLAGLAVLAGVAASRLHDYLLFHSLAESFRIAVAWTIFTTAWNTRRYAANRTLLLLGAGYLLVGGVDLLHTLAYRGMGVFAREDEADLAAQIWVVARYLEAATLLLAPLAGRFRWRVFPAAGALTLAAVLALASILAWDVFPRCFVEGVGLTPFKTGSEYAICGLLGAAAVAFRAVRADFDPGVLRLIYGSLALAVGSELAFTLYTDPYGPANLLGHLLKIVSAYLIYRALVVTSLQEPYRLLFRDLERQRDVLREREEHIRLLLDSTAEAIYGLDTSGRCTFVNPACVRLLGYESEARLVGRPMHELVHHHHADGRPLPREACPILRAAQSGTGVHCDDEVLWRADGIAVPVEYWSYPILHEGAVVGAVVTFLDITERRTAESEIRKNEQMYRRLLESTNTVPWELDLATGRFSYIGPQCERIFGYPCESWTDIDAWAARVHPEDRDDAAGYCAAATKRGEDHDFVYRALRADGSVRWILDIVTVVSGPEGPERLVGFMHDITDLKRTELALGESEARFEVLFNHAPIGYLTLDEAGRLVEINDTWLGMVGHERQDVVGHNLAEFVVEAQRPALAARIARALATGDVDANECVLRRKDGTTLDVALDGTIRQDGEEGLPRLHCVVRDVAELKRVQAERRALEDRLRHAQKMEAIGTLAGGIAHDFNNILSAIIGFAELAQSDVGPGSVVAEPLQEILTAGGRAKDLVHQILAFARKSDRESRPLRARPVVQEVLRLLRATLPSTIALRKDLRSDAVVLGDPTELHQVLMNLCTNAALAMADRRGTIAVSLEDVDLDEPPIQGVTAGSWLRLRVRDDGCGIAPETLARIFDPYFTTRAAGDGTGLGLALVHGMVTARGGAVDVHSVLGEGTTFDVYLPRLEARVEPTAELRPTIERGAGHVLVVDDEPAIVRLIQKALTNLGYRVTAFRDGRDALRALQDSPDSFDLLLTDQTMPGLTGTQVAKTARALRPDLPVLLCTGYHEGLTEEIARTAGADVLLMKPFSVYQLAQSTRDALARAGRDALARAGRDALDRAGHDALERADRATDGSSR